MLSKYNEFKEVLATYHMSERAKQALVDLHLVLLVAPSSTGRNTVIREIVKSYNYYFVVSDTTRKPQVRDGSEEQNGVHYFFRSEEDMLADLRAGEFLEAELLHEQQVSGISIRELEKAKQLNQVAITDIGCMGADNVMKASPKAKAIFLLPPSFDEWQKRIMSRGHMRPDEFKNRMRSAIKELETARSHKYYHFVITENVMQSAAIIDAISHDGPNPHQGRGEQLVHQLEYDIKQKLDTIF